MVTSKLEKVGNSVLYYILKLILNEYTMDDIVLDRNILTDTSFKGVCEDSGELVGYDLDILDMNYLVATLKLNENVDYTQKKPSKLERPMAKEYSFETDEFRTEYVRRTYKNEITSYSRDLVYTTIEGLDEEGYLIYYDGLEVDTDYYDGETTDVKIDKNSIEEVD